jgi:hypothetical protein
MKFLYEDLADSILCESNHDDAELFLEEAEDWVADGKYQSRSIIFRHKDKYYRINESRSGSPFSEYHYEEQEVDKDGYVFCEQVFPTEVIVKEWKFSPGPTEVSCLREDLEEARNLLSEARNIMDNVHLYESEIYKEIGNFLYGEDEE